MDNTNQQLIDDLKQTITHMRATLADIEQQTVKMVPIADYKNIVHEFIHITEVLVQQFQQSAQDRTYIQLLQDQLQALLPVQINNPTLN